MRAQCKRLLWAVLFFGALPAFAQNTAITGTVIDPNGLPYAGGTIMPQLVLVGGASPTVNGFFYLPPTSPTLLSSGGVFSISLPANASITPAGSQWKFNVCSGAGSIQPAGGKGSVCFNVTVTISGGSQDISTQLQAAAPALAFAAGIPAGSNIATPNISSPTTTGTDAGTETLQNKRATPRAVAVTNATSITPNSDTSDMVTQVNTQVGGTLTINAPTGTPTDGQKLIIRVTSTNPQTYSFNAAYRFSATTVAPTTLAGTKTDYIGCIWNANASVWDVVAVDQGH